MLDNEVMFIFANPHSGAEVAIPPKIVSDLAGALLGLMTTRQDGVSLVQHGYEVLLTSVKPGSLTLMYVIRKVWKQKLVSAGQISTAADAYSLGHSIISDLITLAVGAGIMQVKAGSEQPAITYDMSTVVNLNMHVDQPTIQGWDRIARIVETAKVEEVCMRVEGLPDLIIAGENSRDVSLVGSTGEPVKANGEFVGEIHELSGRHQFIRAGRKPPEEPFIDIYTGYIELDGKKVPVAIRWESKSRVTEAIDARKAIMVRGRIETLDFAGLEALTPIPEALRTASKLLVVEKRIEVTES